MPYDFVEINKAENDQCKLMFTCNIIFFLASLIEKIVLDNQKKTYFEKDIVIVTRNASFIGSKATLNTLLNFREKKLSRTYQGVIFTLV